jgi:aspartyl/asparaginyl beta-hydroxylase (cupin superfamily)
MPAKQMPLIQLGNHLNYKDYQDKFNQLYDTPSIVDPLNRHLYLPPNSCEHFCLKPRSWEPGFVSVAASWQQIRAERIGWLLEAVRDPDEIRPNHQFSNSNKQAYLLNIIPELPHPQTVEFYYFYCLSRSC